MSTNWFSATLDSRGSLNLPVDIKRVTGLSPSSSVLVRETDGIILVIPITPEVSQAQSRGTLASLVDSRLGHVLPPAPVSVSGLALVEAAKTQRAREKHQQKMEQLKLQHELLLARKGSYIPPVPPELNGESAVPAAADPDWVEDGAGNRLLCAVCREPQFTTLHGVRCKNGHGGAAGTLPVVGLPGL